MRHGRLLYGKDEKELWDIEHQFDFTEADEEAIIAEDREAHKQFWEEVAKEREE